MPNCPKCHELKYKMDVAAAQTVKTAANFLELADDAPETFAALSAMRIAKEALDRREIEYETHLAQHATSKTAAA